MEEMMHLETTETAAAEATTPEAAEVDAHQPAAEAEPEAQPQAEGEPEAAENPPAEEAAQDGEQEAAPAFTIPVKYNKQYRELTPEEAGAYAQKGMRYEALEPRLQKLRAVCSRSGSSLEDMLDGIYRAAESAELQRIREKAGGDKELEKQLIEAHNIRSKAAIDAVLEAERKAAESEKEDNNKRLADQFAALQAEFPEVSKIGDVPKSVMQHALKTGDSLLASYLLHTHKENKRVQRTQAQKAVAAKATTGSQASGAGPSDTSPEIAAMMQGIWG